VQNELVAKYASPAYSWEYARSEIEFLFKTDSGAVIPVEVKSGKRTRAKSLDVYVQRYQPEKKLNLLAQQVQWINRRLWFCHYIMLLK
jgi:predicted AAA+ superfamily ATPase